MAIHWNGAGWVQKPPHPGDELMAVDATTRSHVWAVARTGRAHLFRRANSNWVPVKTPIPAGAGSSGLTSLAVVSDSDVWAAGWYHRRGHPQRTMVLHWNGAEWTVFRTPNAGASSSSFTAIDARSDSDVWAAGYSGPYNNEQTLTAHWDGTKWTRIPSPSPGSAELSGIAVNAQDRAWAVGTTQPGGSSTRTLVLRWNGKAWTMATSPNPNANASAGDGLSAVTALPNGWHAYAVGTMPADQNSTTAAGTRPLAMRC